MLPEMVAVPNWPHSGTAHPSKRIDNGEYTDGVCHEGIPLARWSKRLFITAISILGSQMVGVYTNPDLRGTPRRSSSPSTAPHRANGTFTENERFGIRRRGEPQAVLMSFQDYVRTIAPPPRWLQQIWPNAGIKASTR
jgi:hypothetical protein